MGQSNKERVIITVLGENRPGVLADITNEVAAVNGDIEDLTQRILQGLFALMMVVDFSQASCPFGEFQARLTKIGDEKKVKVICQHENVFAFMHRL